MSVPSRSRPGWRDLRVVFLLGAAAVLATGYTACGGDADRNFEDDDGDASAGASGQGGLPGTGGNAGSSGSSGSSGSAGEGGSSGRGGNAGTGGTRDASDDARDDGPNSGIR
ncbi:MAG TPA: hypothetical protein VK524_20035 [Polyangiaceae bacterium]|nr:hypothetical protein [Polyangiaceae bacterium]